MQFTWIFVLIAGAIIFAFLMGVIGKQKGLADDRDALVVKNKLSSMFQVAQSGASTSARVSIPDTTITFVCDDPLSPSFRVGERGASDAVQGLVFSQKSLKGSTLLTWTQDWKIPYSAGNFLYLANPRTRFIFYEPTGAQAVINWLLEGFPQEFDKVIITDKDNPDDQVVLKSSGFDTYVIVQEIGANKITDADLEALGGFSKSSEKVFILTVSPNQGHLYGSVDFHRYKNVDQSTEGTGYYYRKELLLGALFSPEFDNYACLMQRAFIGAKAVTELHFRRVGMIDADAKDTFTPGALGTRNPRCEDLYFYIMYAFHNQSWPYCGNVGVMEDVVMLVRNERSPIAEGTDPSLDDQCQGQCNANACLDNGNDFQRLEDNYYRIMRETEDITLEGSCPYVY